MPGELPLLGADVDSEQVTSDKHRVLYANANRVEDHVPIFF